MKSEEPKESEKIEEGTQQPEPPWKIVLKYWPDDYEGIRERVAVEGPELATRRIVMLEMDLTAHRNNLMYMSEALGRMTTRLNNAKAALEKEQESCKEWFHKADDLEMENIELKAEIRRLKSKGKGKKP